MPEDRVLIHRLSLIAPKHGVERGSADLGEPGDLGFRDACLKGARSQFSDRLGLSKGLGLGGGPSFAVSGEGASDLVHDNQCKLLDKWSVKHFTMLMTDAAPAARAAFEKSAATYTRRPARIIKIASDGSIEAYIFTAIACFITRFPADGSGSLWAKVSG